MFQYKFLLKEPIYASILSVGKDSTAIVDAGSVDGLRAGMGLTNIKAIWEVPEFTVISVRERQATIKRTLDQNSPIYEGDQLSTRGPEHTEVMLLN